MSNCLQWVCQKKRYYKPLNKVLAVNFQQLQNNKSLTNFLERRRQKLRFPKTCKAGPRGFRSRVRSWRTFQWNFARRPSRSRSTSGPRSTRSGQESVVSKDESVRFLEPSPIRRKTFRQLLRIVLGGEQGSGGADSRIARLETGKCAESSSSDFKATFNHVGRAGGKVLVVHCNSFARFVKVN